MVVSLFLGAILWLKKYPIHIIIIDIYIFFFKMWFRPFWILLLVIIGPKPKWCLLFWCIDMLWYVSKYLLLLYDYRSYYTRTVQFLVNLTVNFYYCTALPIIHTVLKNQVCTTHKYWSYNRNLRVCRWGMFILCKELLHI